MIGNYLTHGPSNVAYMQANIKRLHYLLWDEHNCATSFCSPLCPDDKTKNQHYPRREADVGCRALLLLCCAVYTSTQVQGSQTDFVGDLQMRYALKVSIFLIDSFLADWVGVFASILWLLHQGYHLLLLGGRGKKKVLGHVKLTYQTFDVEHMLPWFWRASFLVGLFALVCKCCICWFCSPNEIRLEGM
jgi:hypothetical protein